jgi:acylphosphatase
VTPVPEARHDIVPEARHDIVPEARHDIVPEARNETAPEARMTPPGETSGPGRRLLAWVEGRVQGVGFRWWVRARALERGLAGYAENLADGRVKVLAEGPESGCRELLGLLSEGSGPGWVRQVTHRWEPAAGGLSGFTER